jgi:hypothetical protein
VVKGIRVSTWHNPPVTRTPPHCRAIRVALPFAIALGAAHSAPGQSAAITIDNASTLEICSAYVFRPDGDEGADRLGDVETIAPAASRAFEVGPGRWNVMVRDCEDGTIVDFAFRLPAGSEMTVGGRGAVPVKIRNAGDERLCEVKDGDDNVLPHWSDPAYPSSREFAALDSGEAAWIFLPPGVHTLAARSCEGETVQYGRIEVPRQTVWTVDGQAAAECQVRDAPRRILGLERLYFRRIDGPTASDASVAKSIGVAALRPLIPETLGDGPRYWQRFFPEETAGRDLTVQDFPLPTPEGAPEWVLREVRDTSNRLTEQWWLLYDDGCRVDAWYFTPDPGLMEGKLLTELAIASVARPQPDHFVVSVAGRMDRPGGAWWQMTADLVFALAQGGATLQRVANRSRVDHDYDRSGVPITMGAVVERDVTHEGKSMVEVRSRAGISERRAAPCLSETAKVTSAVGVAECLVAGPGASVRYRPLEDPSPIERRR